jgi:uncharacterized protein (TIRG00374 family)
MAPLAEASVEPPPAVPGAGRSVGRRRAWVAARACFVLIVAAVGVEVVISNSAELSGSTAYLQDIRPGWIAVAVGAEAFAYVASAFLQRRLLRAGGADLSLAPLAGIALAGNALNTSIPGGGAMAGVFAFRQLRRRGVDEALTTWTLVAFTSITALTLAFLSLAGLLIAGSNSDVTGLAPLVLLLTVGPVLGIVVLLRPRVLGPLLTRPLGWTRRRVHLPRREVHDVLPQLIERLETVRPRLVDWAAAAGFSLTNWLADCLCLVAAAGAVGTAVPWRGLLLAYGAAQVAANLPVTPGGLGVVEGSLTVALVAYGGPTEAMVAAVVLYRIISFWAVLPIGWGVWLLMVLRARRRPVPA